MVGELSNPFSTGAGGGTFEGKVQAGFVASMIVGGPCPCVPIGSIESIRLQSKQAGFDTDDALVTVVTAAGHRHRLLCQIKHSVAFTQSNEAFCQSILAAWNDFNAAERFTKGRDAIAICTGPQSAKVIDHVRPVLEWARHSDNAGEFFPKVEAKQFSSDSKRDFIEAVRSIITAAGSSPASEDLLWRFLCALHIVSFDFDVEHSQSEGLVVTMLQIAKEPTCPESAQGLWAQIVDLTRSFNQNAGTITQQVLETSLTSSLKQAFAKSPKILEASSLARLKEHTDFILQRISHEIISGVSLERRSVVDQAIDLLEQNQVLVITGDSGDGKSVLAKFAIGRMGDERIPTFGFRVEEFDAPHIHQALAGMGIADNLATLSSRFALLPRKVLFVDSLERLFELHSRDAFAQLLDTLAGDHTWRMILSCRIQAVDLLVNHVLAPSGLSVATLKVPRLDDTELQWIAERAPQIKPHLNDSRLTDLLRIPFYLKIACNASDDLLQKQAGLTAHFDIAQVFWREAVQKPSEQRDGLPMRREDAFVQIAVRRAKSMQAFVSARWIDPEVVRILESDGLIAKDGQGFYAPSQDLLEDWALRSHVAHCFQEANGDWLSFFEHTGSEPALRRAFRIWLTHSLTGRDSVRIADFVIDVSRNTHIPQHWRDEVLVGILLSDSADVLVQRIGPVLLENDKAILIRTIHLLRTACKGPNDSFFKSLGNTRGKVNPFLAVTFTKPRGRGWEAIIGFLGRNIDSFTLDQANLIQGLLMDWTSSLDLTSPLPPEGTHCANLALKYFYLLTEENVLGHDLAKKFLEILLKIPNALPDKIRELYAVPAPKRRTRYSSDRRTRLLFESAIKSLQCVPLCRHFPEIVMRVLELSVWRVSSEDEGYSSGVEGYFGINAHSHMVYFPASALQGPFLCLLMWHPTTAVPYLIKFIDRAATAYAQSELDGRTPQVPLRLGNGHERLIYSSLRLWCMYRGTQVCPHILESALMGFEQWLLTLVERGEDISPWLRFVYENATSVAPVAVLASVALAAPNAFGSDVLPLMRTLDLFRHDMKRKVLDGHHTSDIRSALGFSLGGLKDIYYDERKKSNAKAHRKDHLEQLALKLQVGPLRPEILSAIDVMKGDLSKQPTPTVEDQLMLKRMDIREYETIGKTDKGILIQVKVEEPEIRSAVDASQQQFQHYSKIIRLHNWAMKSWDRTEERNEYPDWHVALSEAQQIGQESSEVRDGTNKHSDDDLYDHRGLRVLAYVAAYLIRDHRQELDEHQLSWCLHEIREAIEEHADTTDTTTVVGKFAMHGSRPAAKVLPLLLDVSNSINHGALVRTLILKALTHAIEEVRQVAASGVKKWLWERDPDFAERCFTGLTEFAALRKQALEASWRSRDRGPTFDERSHQLAQELRSRLGSGLATTAPKTVLLNDVIPEDLLEALCLLPIDQKGVKYAQLFAGIMREVANAEATHAAARSRDREPLNHEFRFGFSALFAEFIHSIGGLAPGLMEALIESIPRGPEIATQTLQSILLLEDRSSSGEHFWNVWKGCAEKAFQSEILKGTSRRLGYDECRKLIRTLLFAETQWKDGLKTWVPLQRHQEFIDMAFNQVGATAVGLTALVRLVRTIGQFLLPEALTSIDDAKSRISDGTELEEGLQYELELLLRDGVLSMGTQIRSREVVRKATLNLLDYLVNEGSSMAFQIRELLVAPIRSGVGDGS